MGWHGPRGECGCCGDVSSSPSSSSSISSIFDPCNCDEESTYYIKLEISGFLSYYEGWQRTTNPDECCIVQQGDYSGLNGTYFIPLERTCPSRIFNLPETSGTAEFPGVYVVAQGIELVRDVCGLDLVPSAFTPTLRVERAGSPIGSSFKITPIGFFGGGGPITVPLDGICNLTLPSGVLQYQTARASDCFTSVLEDTGMVAYSLVEGPTP